jgi:peptide deformylase
MEIVKYPHPALSWKSSPIREISPALRRAVRIMFELMYESRGVGLAANQVGLPFRFFIVNVTGDPEEKDEEFVFINPEITYRKGSVEGEEGCLSLPELFGPVRRAEQIVVEAFDLDGQAFQMNLDDLPARIVQHENDHLDGHVFIDRMAETARNEVAGRISDFETFFHRQQEAEKCSGTDALKQQLRELEEMGTVPESFVVSPKPASEPA